MTGLHNPGKSWTHVHAKILSQKTRKGAGGGKDEEQGEMREEKEKKGDE